MEGKMLSKDGDEGKKELSLEKILEIEKAYFDLMKAYSSCLTTLKLKKLEFKEWFSIHPSIWSTESLLAGNILAPRIIKWRIRKQVGLLREAFLLLIAQNRNKIGPKIIKQFELYCEDMDKLSAQFEKTGLIALFSTSSIPLVAAILVQITPVFLKVVYVSLYNRIVKAYGSLYYDIYIYYMYFAFIYLLIFVYYFLVAGFFGSRRVFREHQLLHPFILLTKKISAF